MHHIMWKWLDALIIVDGTIKDNVSRFQIIFSETLVRQQVELISLVPLAESETKVTSEIEDHLSDEGTAVQKQWRIVQWICRFMVLLSIRNANILLGCLDELGPKLVLEVLIAPVDFRLLQVFVQFELIELFLLELLEGILYGLSGLQLLQQIHLLIALRVLFFPARFHLSI